MRGHLLLLPSSVLVNPIEKQQPDVVQVRYSHLAPRLNASQRDSGGLRETSSVVPRVPCADVAAPVTTGNILDPKIERSGAPVTAHLTPPDPDEQQALLDYNADFNHINVASVIERR